MEARREARLYQVRQVQAACRADVGPVRRQGREGRQGRVGVDPRCRDPGQRTAQWRDRLSGRRLDRPPAAGREGQGHTCHQGPYVQPVRLPDELASAALQQREDPPGRRHGPQPGGLPAGQCRRQALLADLQGDVHLRLAAGDRRRHGGTDRGQCRQGQGPAGRGGLRRHAGHAAGAERSRCHQAARPRGQVAAREGRLQGRHDLDGLAERDRAPRQEGAGF